MTHPDKQAALASAKLRLLMDPRDEMEALIYREFLTQAAELERVFDMLNAKKRLQTTGHGESGYFVYWGDVLAALKKAE